MSVAADQEHQKSTTTTPPAGRVGRITSEAKGLVDDVKTWVEVKLQLFELELEERIEGVANRLIVGAIIGVLAFLALTFFLTAAALGLGAWWENVPLGFVAVGSVLLVTALLLHWLKPKLVQRPEPKPAPSAKKRLPPGVPPSRTLSTSSTDLNGTV